MKSSRSGLSPTTYAVCEVADGKNNGVITSVILPLWMDFTVKFNLMWGVSDSLFNIVCCMSLFHSNFA